jgi:hypothetical protein
LFGTTTVGACLGFCGRGGVSEKNGAIGESFGACAGARVALVEATATTTPLITRTPTTSKPTKRRTAP